MSSLMQHSGAIRNGKVELLLYRQELEPQKPCRCDNCGTDSPDGWNCGNCGRLFWGRYDEKHELTRREFTQEESDLCRTGKLNCSAAACFPLRHKIDSEPQTLVRADGTKMIVPKLYRIWRKPVGTWGCWVVFRYNGKENVPDLSCPIGVDSLPRDSKPLTDDEAIAAWAR